MKYQMYALIDGKTRYKTTFFRHEIVIQLMYTAHIEKEQYKNIGQELLINKFLHKTRKRQKRQNKTVEINQVNILISCIIDN